ncbi:hypothetical protein V6Z11_A02G014900 [Gossypium hirsutum]
MFFLSAWKPKVEDGHFNSISTNHKFEDFNPNPLSLQPLQRFPEGLILNRLTALAEIHDISKDLCCKYKLLLALTWASKVNNLNEIISDPNKKHAFFIQSSSCYVKDQNAYQLMYLCEVGTTFIVDKALESSDGYHFEPSIIKDYPGVENCNIDAVAICLQNRYTSNDDYVVEFFWPATKIEKSKSLALDILNDLKHLKPEFVAVKIQGIEIGFQKEAISNIPTSSNTIRPLKIAEEGRDVHAIEIKGHIEQVITFPRIFLYYFNTELIMD